MTDGFARAQHAFDNATGYDCDPATPCAHCPHPLEDHDHDAENAATPCSQCECDDYDEYTRDDWDADEGDRIYSEHKERF